MSADLIHRIAEILDHPSVFMGGPSRQSTRKAEAIVKMLEDTRRAPVSAGKVKALVWEEYGEDCFFWKAPLFGAILVKRHWKGHWVAVWSTPGYTEVFAPGHFDTPEEAKAAAEARIISALQPGDGWQDISSAPRDGQTVLLHGLLHYPGIDAVTPKTVLAHWTGHNGGGWVWHGPLAIRFTHWMPLPAPPLPQGEETR